MFYFSKICDLTKIERILIKWQKENQYQFLPNIISTGPNLQLSLSLSFVHIFVLKPEYESRLMRFRLSQKDNPQDRILDILV